MAQGRGWPKAGYLPPLLLLEIPIVRRKHKMCFRSKTILGTIRRKTTLGTIRDDNFEKSCKFIFVRFIHIKFSECMIGFCFLVLCFPSHMPFSFTNKNIRCTTQFSALKFSERQHLCKLIFFPALW